MVAVVAVVAWVAGVEVAAVTAVTAVTAVIADSGSCGVVPGHTRYTHDVPSIGTSEVLELS